MNFSAFEKNFKVAIYRPKADARKTFANHFIYLISAGMCIYVTKHFQDDLALPRHPEVGLIQQTGNLLSIKWKYCITLITP